MTQPADRWRWFRVNLDTRTVPCFVLVWAQNMADVLHAVAQRHPRRTVTEVSDPGDAWDVIDLRDHPVPTDLGEYT